VPSSYPPPKLLLNSSYPAKGGSRVVWPKALFPVLFLALLALGCAPKKEARLLRYAFSTEGVQRYRTTFEMSSSSGSGTNILLEVSNRVQDISLDGNARMEVRFDTAEVHLSDPQSVAAAFLARSLQGKVLDFRVSSRGEIGSIEDSSAQGSPAGVTLAQTFSQIFPPLPEPAVRPGDSWTSERTVPVASGQMEATNHVLTRYTLKGLEVKAGKECARVQMKTTSRLQSASQDAGGKKLLGTMTGEGEYLFALAEGRMLSLTMKSKTEVRVQNEAGEASKTTSEQTVKVEAVQ
jgi:hypothetical protein